MGAVCPQPGAAEINENACTAQHLSLLGLKVTTADDRLYTPCCYSELCLVLPSTILPEPYASQHKLVSISGTSLHFWLQRSRGHHRRLRATGCISSKWVLPGTIIPVQGTRMALPSGWSHRNSIVWKLQWPLSEWSFCVLTQKPSVSFHPAVSQIRVKGWLASLGRYICLMNMSV